jgi:phosphopantothenoylcysteine decarboxylase/phosphopantothenate--cysteine ligase
MPKNVELYLMLKGKKILLGVTGSIAAYKTANLVRLFVKAGAEVKIISTAAANDFITPLTLSTLSKHKVLSNIFDENSWNDHVHLGRWADVMLIAPLSCNTLAKMANGICDNLLLAVYLSSTCKVIVAPAMDEDMWKHPSTKANLLKINTYGNLVLPVVHGELASGLIGEGRMAEPEEIITYLEKYFATKNDLAGKKIIITAGPTYEAIDPVRFIGNHSSGKMGVAIAKEAAQRGAKVTLILGPVQHKFDLGGISVIHVTSASQMFSAAVKAFKTADIAIMSAAVADYMPLNVAKQKIKKMEGTLELQLTKTKDILKHLGTLKTNKQLLIGFALETNNEKEYALKKLKDKNADFIVLNSLNDKGATFGSDQNKVTIFDKAKKEYAFEMKSKEAVAKDILDIVLQKIKK